MLNFAWRDGSTQHIRFNYVSFTKSENDLKEELLNFHPRVNCNQNKMTHKQTVSMTRYSPELSINQVHICLLLVPSNLRVQ